MVCSFMLIVLPAMLLRGIGGFFYGLLFGKKAAAPAPAAQPPHGRAASRACQGVALPEAKLGIPSQPAQRKPVARAFLLASSPKVLVNDSSLALPPSLSSGER